MRFRMPRLTVWLLFSLILLALTVPTVLGLGPSRLDPRLLEEFAASPETSFLVYLNVQADLSAAARVEGRIERGQYVYDALRIVAEASQARLRADLDSWGAPYHPYYIVNALLVTGDEALARKLAVRPEVARIVADPAFSGIDDPPPGPEAPPALAGVEWNISRLGAPDVWALGHTGQGIVVGSCDTGVEYGHPALVEQYRGNLGFGQFEHDYNWHDAFGEYLLPSDPNGHGTHTTGTMVGDDGGANQIGMAPGAEWIACKVSSAGGLWKASRYIDCWEWFLAPTRVDGSDPDPAKAPHVINNSWSCPGSEGCDPYTLRDAARALYAAGIAITKSAGNSGPGCSTITNPDYTELLSTAAFAQGDTIASFSSRGPVTRDGKTIVKPDIAAPGVSIRSAVPGGGYQGGWSGTSMAAPHTAGLIALLWSAQPELIGDLDATYQILEATAEPKVDLQCPPNAPGGVPNNVWGWGILDAPAAVLAATQTGLGAVGGTVTAAGSGDPLPGVALQIVPVAGGPGREAETGPDGTYQETLLADTYDLTATLYAYLPVSVAGVEVISDTVMTVDLALDPAPHWTLSGTVTDWDSGEPLAAALTLVDTPVGVETDPATGTYEASVAEGTYLLRATSPGYLPQERTIAVDGDLNEDFELLPTDDYTWRDSTMPCGSEFDWIDITTTGEAHTLGDDAAKNISIGGSFTYYGISWPSVYVSSNGYLSFGSGSSWPGGNAIPSTFQPNNAIYAFWDDLNPAYGAQGTIYTELLHDRFFVVEFYRVEHWPAGNPETFEIILDLATGTIKLQYLEVSDTSWTSVGIENSSGTSGLAYAFHDPALPFDELAVAFYPTHGAPPPVGPGEVTGIVSDAHTGDGLEGATVNALSFSAGELFTYTAGVTGSYSATLCPGWYTMTAAIEGYHPSADLPVDVISATQVTQDFALVPIEADLWLTKRAPITATPGVTLTYTLAFGSLGPDAVPEAEVLDLLPDALDYVTSTGGIYDDADHSVTWSFTDVLSGFSGVATIVVQVPKETPGGEVRNEARFQAVGERAPSDPDPGNDGDEAWTEIQVTQRNYTRYLPLVLRSFGP